MVNGRDPAACEARDEARGGGEVLFGFKADRPETRSVSGIFRALRLWRNVIGYRSDGVVLGGFMRVMLQRLAAGTDDSPSTITLCASKRALIG